MKPRLRMQYGVWSCVSWSPRIAGHGYTWREAWQDWAQAVARYIGATV